jgi:hypothetical protein
VALMSGLVANIKLSLSKWKAKAKLAQLEREAAEEDRKEDAGKLQRRKINWETSTEMHGRWD